MSASRLAWLIRLLPKVGAATAAAAVAAVALVAAPGTGLASARSPREFRQLTYRGYRFELPGSWPVINISRHRTTCVQFDQHAVYLGAPGRNQACPSALMGTTEAVLIQPAGRNARLSSVENRVARQITVTAPRIRIIATFDTHPGQIDRLLASASLPAPTLRVPAGNRVVPTLRALRRAGGGDLATEPGSLPGSSGPAAPILPQGVTNFHGLGFDTCAAPSTGYMSAWRQHAPYDAVGIYIGGSDRACAQPNLTPRWVSAQAAAGWHFIPLYAGPQAAFGELTAPARQAAQDAADAAAQAELFGFQPRSVIYYDMEAYPAAESSAALKFMSAWTVSLHKLGYQSGIYSSSGSGISDLVSHYSRHRYVMPNVIYDALWDNEPNTRDPVYGPGQWTNSHRVHQYRANIRQTFGGDTIMIDQDALNVSLPGLGGTPQPSPAVQQPGGAVYVFYRGAGHRLWYDVHGTRSGWSRPAPLGAVARSAPSAVVAGQRKIMVFYQGPGGHLWKIVSRTGVHWSHPEKLSKMGVLGGAPRAVAQPNGTVNVFWQGASNDRLWDGRYTPRHGWDGPAKVGGHLGSAPWPLISSRGKLQVVWASADPGRNLVRTVLMPDGHWGRPRRLRIGPVGSAVSATAQPTGQVEVFWRSASCHLWGAFYGQSGHWTRPRNLGGGVWRAPLPITASGGQVRVLWASSNGTLWQVAGRPGQRWQAPSQLPVTGLTSAPFAAVGTSLSRNVIFWQDAGGALWSATIGGLDRAAAQRLVSGQRAGACAAG